MSGSKWILGVAAVALAVAMATPTYAGKKVITDSEMDEVTAAGQPIVLKNDDGGIDVATETNLSLEIGDEAQQDLRALILNNTIGENQVGTGMNIASGGSTGRQDNNITQSWGSTYDRKIIDGTVRGGSVRTSEGEDGECGDSALICKPVGGDGEAVATLGAVTQQATRLSIYSDQIVLSDDDDLDYRPETNIALDVRDTAQSGLSALVVNNVAGLNQVANGVNIAGSVRTGPVGAGNVSTNSLAASAGQGNITNQFRGTSFSRPQ